MAGLSLQIIQPSYLGYSVGKWEGDRVVVDTIGLNNKGWLDMNGHPQTEATHLTEHFGDATSGA